MNGIVEAVCDTEELSQAPCTHGHIVAGHACYCHDDAWKEGPRKCPIWRQWGVSDPAKWHRRDWPLEEVVVFQRYAPPAYTKTEMLPCMPDDGLGGCPHFIPMEVVP